MIGMEDKFVLELGYELLSLVDRDNHPELLDGILNLRKQKPYIPKIRIMDNITLEPFEISLNKERSILNKEENLTSQILTIIENFVEKHSEIWEEKKLVVKPGEMLTGKGVQRDDICRCDGVGWGKELELYNKCGYLWYNVLYGWKMERQFKKEKMYSKYLDSLKSEERTNLINKLANIYSNTGET